MKNLDLLGYDGKLAGLSSSSYPAPDLSFSGWSMRDFFLLASPLFPLVSFYLSFRFAVWHLSKHA